MFERRLRVLLICLVIGCAALLGRAAQVQILEHQDWVQAAEETLVFDRLTETVRGRILDIKGRVLAEDVPCTDACVDFRVIGEEPDEKWLFYAAREIARETPGYYDLKSAEQLARVEEAKAVVKERIEAMWNLLAEVGGVTRAEIDQTRHDIVQRVKQRRQDIVNARYRAALRRHEAAGVPAWWRRWFMSEADAKPTLEEFDEPIADESMAHPILRDLSTQAYNTLKKREAELPGLQLLAGRTRRYPYGNIVCHVIGRLGKVTATDLENDPTPEDSLRRYYSNDQIGRGGIEALAEQQLRGTRGQLEFSRVSNSETVTVDAEPGQDVQTTIDVELQRAVRDAFEHVLWEWPSRNQVEAPAPGGAVVIDVKTGNVLSLVSYPDYDPNKFDELYKRLAEDELNRPLVNRATQFATVPGSTIKPVVGIGAITDGLIPWDGTIECTGYLIIDGRRYTHTGRCWVASMFESQLGREGVAHHQIPYRDPHPSPINPFTPETGHLTYADALQRSCNVFFESLGNEMDLEGLGKWYDRFGLGRPTGVGLPETSGLIPSDLKNPNEQQRRLNKWFGSIGQGHVAATPIQMANVIATFAREGIWMRPTLLADDQSDRRVDLGLDKKGLEMAKRGMVAVVETPAGTGGITKRPDVHIAGKTGSAQADYLVITRRDANGQPIVDEKGRVQYDRIELGSEGNLHPQVPWYRRINEADGSKAKKAHSWYVGYAPAEDPQIAFAVLVEYGGSGGKAAGSVATRIIDAAIKLGYVQPRVTPATTE